VRPGASFIASVAAITAILAGCGAAGSDDVVTTSRARAGSRQATHPHASLAPGQHSVDRLALPALGVLKTKCQAPGPFTMAFTADRVNPDDQVAVRIPGERVRRADVAPGRTLKISVPAHEWPTAGRVSRRVAWSFFQTSEPHDIRARLRFVLYQADDDANSCSFLRATLSMSTHPN